MLGRDIAEIPIHCARQAARGIPPDEDFRKLLLEYTSVSSWLAEQCFGHGEFRRSAHSPGYLHADVSGRAYFVPYGLLSVFPRGQQLQSIDRLITAVRLSPKSAFCLSGSGTFTGQLSCISDIDFCEYFVEPPQRLQDSLAGMRAETPGRALVRLKLGDQVHFLPFQGMPESVPLAASGAPAPVKLDFIVSTDLFGVIAATNLVLPVDGEMTESPHLKLSFQYQEAVVFETPDAVPQRRLMDPQDIGGYLNWLRQQATEYVAESRKLRQGERGTAFGIPTIKALKRALSWFLMVGLGGSISAIVTLLQKPEMAALANVSRQGEVSWLLNSIEAEPASGLRQKFKLQDASPPEFTSHLNDFFENALSLVEDLVEEIEELMGDRNELEAAA